MRGEFGMERVFREVVLEEEKDLIEKRRILLFKRSIDWFLDVSHV